MPFEVVAQTGGSNPLVVAGVILATLVIAAIAFFRQMVFFSAISGDSDAPPPESQTNCPACGARTPDDRADCEYCGASLDDRSSRPDAEA